MRPKSKTVYLLLFILILINLVLRYPITPHEQGWDSFSIHSLAVSISTYGSAKWWIHPLSTIGYYPFSYASGVPLILSGMSQLTGVNMECTIWVFCVIEGFFATLSAYIMAGEIKNNRLFKFIVALTFSTSGGMLWYTTWTVSTRGLLLLFMPFFIYFLLKTRRPSKTKHASLCVVVFAVSMTIHNLYILLIPILVAYWGSLSIYKYKQRLSTHTKISKPFTFAILITLFGFLFYLPFSGILEQWFSYYVGNIFGYKQIWELAITYGAKIGILVFIGVIGLITLLYKKEKNQLDIFLIILALSLTPLLFSLSYSSLGILILVAILIGLGVLNLTNFLTKKSAKASISVLLILMITSVSWAGLAQVWHPGVLKEITPTQEIYMDYCSYNAAMWLKHYSNANGRIVVNDITLSCRLSAISQAHPMRYGPHEIINGFVSKECIKVRLKPIHRWLNDGPFDLEEPPRTDSEYWYPLYRHDCDDYWSVQMISKFNLTYAIENTKIAGKQTWSNELRNSRFFESIHDKKYKVYESGETAIQYL